MPWQHGLPAVISGPGIDGGTDPDDQAWRYAAALLAEAREEIGRADSKASILLAASGVAAGALLAGIVGGSWSPSGLGPAIQAVWWSGVVAAAAGVWNLAAAIYPRTRRVGTARTGHIEYFGDILAFGDPDALMAALRRECAAGIEPVADQLRQISLIVDRKYRHIRRAMWFLCAAVLACPAAVLLNLVVR